MDYISREKTIREVVKTSTKFCRDPELVANIINSITAIPVADVQEVRSGRWERNDDGIMIWWECSECHHDAWYDRENLFNFCPNCGAKMETDHE